MFVGKCIHPCVPVITRVKIHSANARIRNVLEDRCAWPRKQPRLHSYHFASSIGRYVFCRPGRLVHICLRVSRIRCCVSSITWSTYRNIARSTYVNWVVAWTNNGVAAAAAAATAVVVHHLPSARVKVTTAILCAFEIPSATHSPQERFSPSLSSPFSLLLPSSPAAWYEA